MENREKIVREYFDLIVYLNRSNVSKNKKTEIAFEIRKSSKTEEFGCYLKGIENPVFLVLCRTNRAGRWKTANCTRFIFLEDFCKDSLMLTGEQAVNLISNDLRSLGIKK